jgi:hypothetical protein
MVDEFGDKFVLCDGFVYSIDVAHSYGYKKAITSLELGCLFPAAVALDFTM